MGATSRLAVKVSRRIRQYFIAKYSSRHGRWTCMHDGGRCVDDDMDNMMVMVVRRR